MSMLFVFIIRIVYRHDYLFLKEIRESSRILAQGLKLLSITRRVEWGPSRSANMSPAMRSKSFFLIILQNFDLTISFKKRCATAPIQKKSLAVAARHGEQETKKREPLKNSGSRKGNELCLGTDQRLLNWKRLRAPGRPAFLRSFMRESRVRSFCSRSGAR